MALMNKIIYYKGYKFKITVNLYATLTIPKGTPMHTITTKGRTCNFNKSDLIKTEEIEEFVNKHQRSIINYVDEYVKKMKSDEEVLLSNLGFY